MIISGSKVDVRQNFTRVPALFDGRSLPNDACTYITVALEVPFEAFEVQMLVYTPT